MRYLFGPLALLYKRNPFSLLEELIHTLIPIWHGRYLQIQVYSILREYYLTTETTNEQLFYEIQVKRKGRRGYNF